MIEKAGGIGLFHILVYLGLGAGVNSISAWLYYSIPFYIQKQVYICNLTDGAAEEICTRENICNGDSRITSWEVDFDNNRSLDNW